MRKWNWLQGLRLGIVGAGVALFSTVATAQDVTQIANPDQVFKQTSYNLFGKSCDAPAAQCGPNGDACGNNGKGNGCGPDNGAGCNGDNGRGAGCNGSAGCNGDDGCGLLGLSCDQDEFKLFEGATLNGWIQLGYTSSPTAFNNGNQDDRFILNQAWIALDKAAEGDGDINWGYHADFVYGADGANTNSFGNNPGQFDLDPGFAHGLHADWAIPQLYAEIAMGDTTIKGGHFYTLHGYEVVQATGNFFYSHAYTMNYAEPFTHTGVLVTHQVNDDLEVYAGWTLGFDTGFDQSGGGSNFMGGFSTALGENATLTWIMSAGDFGTGFAPPIVAPVPAPLDSDGSYASSTVIDVALSDELNYVFHSDILRTGVYDTFGINQYLIYEVSECVSAGTRVEWWKSDGRSVNAITAGLNIKPHSNLTIRPEYRYDWSPAGNTNAGINARAARVDQSQGMFGIDVILTF